MQQQELLPKHAAKAAAHFANIYKIGIAICPAIIPAADLTCYKNLLDSVVGKTSVYKHGLNELVSYDAL